MGRPSTRNTKVLHSKKSHKGNWEFASCIRKIINIITSVAFKEIPQRELRGIRPSAFHENQDYVLHSKKSHKGNWERCSRALHQAPASKELHSKKSHKGNWEIALEMSPNLRDVAEVLHSKKSHKGNWENIVNHGCVPVLFIAWLHSKKSHKGNWELGPLRHQRMQRNY